MRISISRAKDRLTELIRRAEAGEVVVLTRHGQLAMRLIPVRMPANADSRRAVIKAARGAAAAKATDGPDAARSQDFLYEGCLWE
jgi:prevent-host-death family protein